MSEITYISKEVSVVEGVSTAEDSKLQGIFSEILMQTKLF